MYRMRSLECAPARFVPVQGPWKILVESHLNTNPATEADITAARPTGALLSKIKAEIETLRQQPAPAPRSTISADDPTDTTPANRETVAARS